MQQQPWQPGSSAPQYHEVFQEGQPYGTSVPASAPPPQQQPVYPPPFPAFSPAPRPEKQLPPLSYDPNPPFQQPAPEEEEPVRDAYSPVDSESLRRRKVRPSEEEAEPRRSIGKSTALIISLILFIFCAVVLATQLIELSASRSSMSETNGTPDGLAMLNAAVRVDLLPAGQTFEPTATPEPTPFAPTPSPTPRIALNNPMMLALNGMDANSIQTTEAPTPTPPARTRLMTYPNNELRNVLPSILKQQETNTDIVGQLVIEGVLNEPVLQRSNTYYLTRNVLGVSSEGGSVFADESCTFLLPPENLLLRGQGDVEGKAFEPLWQFIDGGTAFVSTATTATLTTLYEESQYVLFAVLRASSDPKSENYFNFGSHPTFESDRAMLEYVEDLKAHSLYNFGIDVVATDRLLTLASLNNGDSVVLVYRMVR